MPAADATDDSEIRDEKRFAVVMYGGVSLAVYINGVAQELHRLVKSTLPGSDPPQSGTERIYRQIGEKLRTRFVVDILSGTSAGGINAVFLAKALAQGSSMDRLEKLWLDEGDIAVLINDRKLSKEDAVEGFGLRDGFAPPRSLLKSRRMYRKLIEALEGMDPPPAKPGKTPPPMVPEIDLFVTATDLQGLPVPLKLSDRLVTEYRHRGVFHFKKGPAEGAGDFKAANNAFLAFAARCTSSFPFAFEPMRLVDATAEGAALAAGWEKFCPGYFGTAGAEAGEQRERFARRAFADGGYLDNKPFSYAIEAIARRSGEVPVDRKLIYIEPSPERIRAEQEILEPPNALENTVKVFTLARYETIREDLQALLERNRVVERVERILKGTLADIQSNESKKDPASATDWLNSDLNRMIASEGIAYGGYLRLRVAKLTDDLSEIIVRHAGLDPGSDLFLAVREIVRVWRDARYVYYQKEGDGREKFSHFLKAYNIEYFLSRLRFTIRGIDALVRRADDAVIDQVLLDQEQADWSQPAILVERMKKAGAVKGFRSELKAVRAELRRRLDGLEGLRRSLFEPDPQANPLTLAVAALKLSPAEVVNAILKERPNHISSSAAAEKLLSRHADAFEEIAALIQDAVHRADVHSDLCKQYLGLGMLHRPSEPGAEQEHLRARLEGYLRLRPMSPRSDIELVDSKMARKAPEHPAAAARWAAAFYFRRFPHYDIVAYPILQSCGIGEEIDPVEVIRISPEDADQLSAGGGRKLGGTAIMHFGAFFDRTWRKNDILWGRLDGAERLITCLVAGTELAGARECLVHDAHRAIFEEFFASVLKPAGGGKKRTVEREVLDLLVAAVLGKDPRQRSAVKAKLAAAGDPEAIRRLLEEVVKGGLAAGDIHQRFQGFRIDRQLEPRELLRSISRATQVVGRMLEGIADEFSAAKGRGQRAAAWVTRAGSLLWCLVEVATPGSIWRLYFRHWTALFFGFGAVMFALGPTLGAGEAVSAFGWKLMLAVAILAGIRHLVQAYLMRRFRFLNRIWKGFALAAAVLLCLILFAGVAAIDEKIGAPLGRALCAGWDWMKGFFTAP